MLGVSGGHESLLKEYPPMHDLLIAVAFVVMIIAPALVATHAGAVETEERA